ncbi:MAG: prolyl oligopeptidase family serine peptidase [Pyrinomonadaceae bacterium]|nr:prolyl oligopeptidase family serine peptidase [Pyrinomonadaceae bacterium]
MRFILLSLLVGGIFSFLSPTDARAREKGGLLSRNVKVGNKSYGYQIYMPGKLAGKEKLPVILFLHGIGQRGTGGFVKGAAAILIRQYLERLPAVVVLPQCEKGRYWSDPEMEAMVMATLNDTVAEFKADRERLYMIGVSMGGFGAWHLAAEQRGMFAAFVSICGGSPLRTGERFQTIARRVGRTPVWVFHGMDDRVVPVSESRQMVAALKALGGNVRYSEYEGVGHNVWLNVMKERELLPWLLSQRLSSTK